MNILKVGDNSISLDEKDSAFAIRTKIARFEDAIRKHDGNLGKDPFPLKHTFVPGMYAREIFAPKGMVIVTELHKTEHFVFMLKGDVSIISEDGAKRIQGPCYMVSPVGAKRLVYVHEDTVWINILSNPENITDLDKLEDRLIAKNYTEIGLAEPDIEVKELKEA